MQLWVADNRKAGGYSSKDLADWTGVVVDTARGWESRGRPSEDAIRILERKFGKPAPDAEVEQAGDSELAAALSGLAEELRLSRESRAVLEQKVEDLRLVVAGLTERALQGDPRRPVPDGTKR